MYMIYYQYKLNLIFKQNCIFRSSKYSRSNSFPRYSATNNCETGQYGVNFLCTDCPAGMTGVAGSTLHEWDCVEEPIVDPGVKEEQNEGKEGKGQLVGLMSSSNKRM